MGSSERTPGIGSEQRYAIPPSVPISIYNFLKKDPSEQREFLRTHPVVLGGSGLVGSHFAEKTGGLVIRSNDLDIRNREDVRIMLELFAGGKLVNFAAYTGVDGAERQRTEGEDSEAWQINAIGAMHVAEACEEHGIHLAHLSTGFVFQGTEENHGPYDEHAQPADSEDEISFYGWTKREGERIVHEVNKNAHIVRIDYPYKADGDDRRLGLARWILKAFQDGALPPLYSDQIITPTYIPDVTRALQIILASDERGLIHHVASPDTCSPWTFGDHLLRRMHLIERAPPAGSLHEELEAGATKRPLHGGLGCMETMSRLGFRFKTWEQGIEEVAQILERQAA